MLFVCGGGGGRNATCVTKNLRFVKYNQKSFGVFYSNSCRLLGDNNRPWLASGKKWDGGTDNVCITDHYSSGFTVMSLSRIAFTIRP
ncbi:hypothetical protein CEXT_400521 [Caerostris extrusa]|uniref:Uncharacterized protein n=1 Tax=Caerostris extrusa TaxID=172846 RepID=A0AAV4RGY2_CAEEX|nr:hypothetical protein CEXT_400521 [Caerostris extrusa]